MVLGLIVFIVCLSVCESTTLESYGDGAYFDKCIKITDWVSATYTSDITLTDRDSNGCCASDEVPGQYRNYNYYGAQVICGFEDDGSTSFSTSSSSGTYTCTYNNCFVHKQDLECASGSNQLLNGCCSSSSCAANDCNFGTDCQNYYYTMSNAQGNSTTYCLTYDYNYGTATGNQGLASFDGTSETSDDVEVDGDTKTLDTDKLYMYVECDNDDSTDSTSGVSTYGTMKPLGIVSFFGVAALT